MPKPDKAGRWRQGLALVLLGGGLIWMLAAPSKQSNAVQKKVAQLEQQVQDCNLDQARDALQRLKKLDPEQYQHWQSQIESAKPACDERRARQRDWQATLGMANKALDDAGFDKAAYDRINGRLNWFVKRWKDDDDTRALKQKLDASYGLLLLDLAERCLAKDDSHCVRQRLTQWERLKQDTGHERAERLRAQVPARSAPEARASTAASAQANPRDKALDRALAKPVDKAGEKASAKPLDKAGDKASAKTIDKASVKASEQQGDKAGENSATAQRIKQLQSEAGQAMSWGNYKGASDKLVQCLALPDKGNAACLPLKRRADQLQQEMLRCVNSGNEWIGEHCDKLK
jgi:hypothetical protein